MKTKATQNQLDKIKAAIAKLYVQPFGWESGNPKRNAQQNLNGRTHYFTDETLRFHHGRVLSTWTECDGLLFCAMCSDAADFQNTCRVYRVVVHDVFGTCVSRVSLEDGASTRAAAQKAHDAIEFDVLAHYKSQLNQQIANAKDELRRQREARKILNGR